jgi:hypothetical protein
MYKSLAAELAIVHDAKQATHTQPLSSVHPSIPGQPPGVSTSARLPPAIHGAIADTAGSFVRLESRTSRSKSVVEHSGRDMHRVFSKLTLEKFKAGDRSMLAPHHVTQCYDA